MSEKITDLDAVGGEILQAARSELYLNLPYLDVVLCGLEFRAGKEMTLSLATDGQVLHYNGSFLAERYLRGRVLCNRAYLHVILHCMLRHLHKKYDKVPELWDLACDVAVESILDGLDYACLGRGNAPPLRQRWYHDLRREMPVLTAEGIYRALLRRARIATEHRIEIGQVVLDYDAFTVTRGDEVQELPQKEFLLLYKLLSYPGKIFTRIQLMDEIWGADSETGWETVTVHIGRLRKRFEHWDEFDIVSVRGLGYKAVKKE